MEKEKFVYGVPIDKCDNIDDMSDKDIIEAGKESGVFYSIEGFVDELNCDQLDTENYWFKII